MKRILIGFACTLSMSLQAAEFKRFPNALECLQVEKALETSKDVIDRHFTRLSLSFPGSAYDFVGGYPYIFKDKVVIITCEGGKSRGFDINTMAIMSRKEYDDLRNEKQQKEAEKNNSSLKKYGIQ